MKTEAELRAAFDALTWYVDGDEGNGNQRYLRQSHETQLNVLGALATLEWALGLERDGNPIPGTLCNVALMRQKPERN